MQHGGQFIKLLCLRTHILARDTGGKIAAAAPVAGPKSTLDKVADLQRKLSRKMLKKKSGNVCVHIHKLLCVPYVCMYVCMYV